MSDPNIDLHFVPYFQYVFDKKISNTPEVKLTLFIFLIACNYEKQLWTKYFLFHVYVSTKIDTI